MGRGKADGELIQPRRSEDREQADLYHAASGPIGVEEVERDSHGSFQTKGQQILVCELHSSQSDQPDDFVGLGTERDYLVLEDLQRQALSVGCAQLTYCRVTSLSSPMIWSLVGMGGGGGGGPARRDRCSLEVEVYSSYFSKILRTTLINRRTNEIRASLPSGKSTMVSRTSDFRPSTKTFSFAEELNFSQVYANSFEHILVPVMFWESLDINPKGDLRGKGVRDCRFPLLKDDHPLIIVSKQNWKQPLPRSEPVAFPFRFHRFERKGKRDHNRWIDGFVRRSIRVRELASMRSEVSSSGARILLRIGGDSSLSIHLPLRW
ncbi:hypothetical protein AT2G11225 [Arabidopsis thaliana]|uniref:Uncharacterized protein n=1 Tax=Arabidopsis thaliana TaxID=3702 RepID=A0A1P8AXU1_ARATH|nr:uncharacterized protein AT2G11225 [Arabidopsis thaliana]ANM61491.1 hypothetical protein AT2G11225 [Arabidopsis thaliana]|eukprot:NP_001323707.1 hypothetical protein AT2G11225 [Arabidopsis thaliana]